MSPTGTQVDLTQSQQANLRMLLIAMTIVPTIVVLIRAWSRALLPVSAASKIPTKFWWDDWTAFAAAALNIAVCGMGLRLVQLGLGLHIEAVPPENIEPFLKFLWVIYYIFDTGTAVSKSSALFFYSRALGVQNSRFRYALWLVHAMNVAWLIAILLGVTFMCNPVQRAWDTTLPGTCLNTGLLWQGSGITSLLIDVIILVLPLPMLWKLQMKTSRKVQITGVFMCGYLVVVVSIGRLITIVQAGDDLEHDPTYLVATPVLWLGSEIAISIISVSLPSVFFLAQRAYREGMWSLIDPRSHASASVSKSRLSSSPNRYHFDDDDDDLVSSPRRSVHNYPGDVSRPNPYHTYTQTTAQFAGPNKDVERAQRDGIHIRNDIVVT